MRQWRSSFGYSWSNQSFISLALFPFFSPSGEAKESVQASKLLKVSKLVDLGSFNRWLTKENNCSLFPSATLLKIALQPLPPSYNSQKFQSPILNQGKLGSLLLYPSALLSNHRAYQFPLSLPPHALKSFHFSS